MRKFFAIFLFSLSFPAPAYDANGVGLGGREIDVKRSFPSAHCKAMEWKSNAAERRCDDARISFGGIDAKITFYLKSDAIQAFDLRFDTRDLERVKSLLRSRYGAPLAEATETIARRDKGERKVFKMRWEKGADRALLTAQLERKRASLEVSRGSFSDEIYRVK